MPDPDLEAFASAARGLLDEELDQHAPMIDLPDVTERAHHIDPDHVPETTIAEASRLAPADNSAQSTMLAAEARQLEAFNEDVRALLDAQLGERDLSARPPLRRLPKPRRTAWTWAAAAAVLLLAGGAVAGLASLAGSNDLALPSEAEYTAEATPSSGGVHASDARTDEALPILPETGADLQIEAEPAPLPPALDEPEPPNAAKPNSEPAGERLAQLDALAQSQWKGGKPRDAEKTFEKIVRLGGKTQYAEQAFGELFALAHQLHGAEHQVKLWRAYLRRFPRGRYADAARAGLCRRGEAASKRRCWTRYLEKHPTGTARVEALRETSG